jgi:hypothetical protein
VDWCFDILASYRGTSVWVSSGAYLRTHIQCCSKVLKVEHWVVDMGELLFLRYHARFWRQLVYVR